MGYSHILRRIICNFRRLWGMEFKLPELSYVRGRKEANRILCECLSGTESCMIARFGSNELAVINNYLNVRDPHRYWRYLNGQINEYDWNKGKIESFQTCAGFYPCSEEAVGRYVDMCVEDMKEVDVLGSWLKEEYYVEKYLSRLKYKLRLHLLEPDYFTVDASEEWTQLLRNKNVLVIHPFEDSIKRQFKKKHLLFQSPDLIPDFNLLTLKAVQSIGGKASFPTWFDALDWMKKEMDKADYDIAIIGCGAYGFNLAAHAKRTGHKAIHLGGATQLLFGIIGKRWEDREDYSLLFNKHWCRPNDDERPAIAYKVEGACYW